MKATHHLQCLNKTRCYFLEREILVHQELMQGSPIACVLEESRPDAHYCPFWHNNLWIALSLGASAACAAQTRYVCVVSFTFLHNHVGIAGFQITVFAKCVHTCKAWLHAHWCFSTVWVVPNVCVTRGLTTQLKTHPFFFSSMLQYTIQPENRSLPTWPT